MEEHWPYVLTMRALLLAAFLSGAMGCSLAVDEVDAVGDVGGERRQHESAARAELSVQRMVTPEGEVRSDVSARFVSVSGDLDHADAQRIIGVGPSLRHHLARMAGTRALGCTFHAASGADSLALQGVPPGAAPLGAGNIELLDVGDISLRMEGQGADGRGAQQVVPLAARAFPDVGEVVSGVVYTTRGVDAPLPDATTYWLEADAALGAGEGLALRVAAPRALSSIDVTQATLVQLGLGRQRFADDLLIVAAGEEMRLNWVAGDSAAGDFVVVSVHGVGARSNGESRTLECMFEDDGSAVIAGEQMSFAAGEDLDLVVHRLRRTRVKLGQPLQRIGEPVVTDAVVWFDFAVSARAAVQ
ncbi:MAG TPA: hypothetical protein ENK23_07435 [Sorangium sp.]|nr:hypothetical protein [Sorangium sp.]